MPQLTIVIPTIGRPTLQRAIDSVMTQTVPTDCLVRIDDLEDGAGITRNKAMEDIKTRWVGFLDDDDVLHPRYHEWLNEEYHEYDLVLFQMAMDGGMVIPRHVDPAKLAYNWMGISFAMKTSLARKFPFHNVLGEDYELMDRLRAAGARIKISEHVAYYVRDVKA
jgi:glycosyltransferase involved in cell wall biosynthesis